MEGGYCLTLLSEATRLPPEGVKPGYCLQNAAKAFGKGATRDLKAG